MADIQGGRGNNSDADTLPRLRMQLGPERHEERGYNMENRMAH